MVANHALVKLKPQTDPGEFLKSLSPYQVTIPTNLSDDLLILQTPEFGLNCNSPPSLIEQLNTDNNWGLYAEPDHLVTSSTSDAPLTKPNALFYTDQPYPEFMDPLYGISAPLGWSTRTSAGNVVVAAIDSGVESDVIPAIRYAAANGKRQQPDSVGGGLPTRIVQPPTTTPIPASASSGDSPMQTDRSKRPHHRSMETAGRNTRCRFCLLGD